MEIFVKTPTGEKRTLKVEATETIESVKAKCIRESGSDGGLQLFSLRGPELSEDHNLRYYRIKNGDTLHLVSNLVQIFVNTPTGEKISLEVNRYDTIRQVKNKIAEKTAIHSRRQLLRFADSPLEDGKTVYDSNLKNGDTIDLIDHVFIKMPTGFGIILEIKRNDTIESVKNQIQAKKDIPQQYQDLFYGRKNLEDGRTLEDYEIPSGVTLHLVQYIIQIFVKMPTEDNLELDVHRYDTIGDVKGKIEAKGGIPRENQSLDLDLFYQRTFLVNDNHTVDDYKIKHGSTLILRLNDIEIDVILPSGHRMPLNVKLNETISSVKAKIEQKKGIRPENQFLGNSGFAKDGDTVKSHIQDNEPKPILRMAKPTVSITVAMFTSPIGKRLSLKVNRNDTIATVKSKLAEKEGDINLENHFLCLGDVRLSESRTLQSCRTQDWRFVLRHFYDCISVSVKSPIYITISITLHPNDTVAHVKEYIQDKEGIPTGRQLLIFASQLLDNSRTMASYNIKNGDTVSLQILGM